MFECMFQRFGRVHSCWMCGLIGRMVYVGILFDLHVPKISKIMQYKWKENLRALHGSRCYNNGKLSKYHCIYQSIWMLFAHKFGILEVCCFWKRHAIRLNWCGLLWTVQCGLLLNLSRDFIDCAFAINLKLMK